MTKDGYINKPLLLNVSRDIKLVKARGYEVVVVSSGAVTCGRTLYQSVSKKVLSDQCLAMIGQPLLMQHWTWALEHHGQIVGQALFTNSALKSELRRRSVLMGINDCLLAGIVPIVNENDAVITDELKEIGTEGDNDQVSANLAIGLEAEMLVFLTTVPYVEDPVTGTAIKIIEASNDTLEKTLSRRQGDSSGGMASKIKYGRKFAMTGGEAIIKHFSCNLPMSRIMSGLYEGTVIKR